MTGARKFLFDRDFRESALSSEDEARMRGEETGYARGLADGQRIANESAAAKLAQSMERLAELAKALNAREAERAQAAEREAAALALAFARKIAGDALLKEPTSALEEAARDCFRHLRGVPHLVVRINEALVEEADAAMRRLSSEHGFDGKLVVLGTPDLAPGDATLEWADGGLVRERARIEEAIAAAVKRVFDRTD